MRSPSAGAGRSGVSASGVRRLRLLQTSFSGGSELGSIARVADQLVQALAAEGAIVTRIGDDRVEVSHVAGGLDRRMTVHIRDDAHFDVAFYVPEKRGSPFEQVFAGSADEGGLVEASVIQFVSDVVGERVVLIWDRRLLVGGRRFVTRTAVSPSTLESCSWMVSWRGTYDFDSRNEVH